MAKTGIVAFAFGLPPQIKANRMIALIVEQKAMELKIPIYTERNIPLQETEIQVAYIRHKPGVAVETLRLAREAVLWAGRNQLTKLLVVAAKPHVKRSMRDLTHIIQKEGISLELEEVQEIDSYSYNEWFSPESVLPHARLPWLWRLREVFFKWLPMPLYEFLVKKAGY